jgi:hypothetical protein
MFVRHVGGVAFAIVACLTFSGSTAWGGGLPEPNQPIRPWVLELGARYWYSTGETNYDLFDFVGNKISRLAYDDLDGHSGEVFFRADHKGGYFLKGYLGAGIIDGGSLDDEDYAVPGVGNPPFATGTKLSDTISTQDDGEIRYFSVDIGYSLIESGHHAGLKGEPTRPTFKLGAFAGFHYLKEELNASGAQCNPGVTPNALYTCGVVAAGTILVPFDVPVISQSSTWRSLRLGLVGDAQISHRLRLTGEVAYVRTDLDAEDTHILRIPADFNGPTPQDGDGNGVQLEAVLSYQLTDKFNVGVGGRYWYMETDGHMHFEQSTIAGGPQPVEFDTERYGVFVQGSVLMN